MCQQDPGGLEGTGTGSSTLQELSYVSVAVKQAHVKGDSTDSGNSGTKFYKLLGMPFPIFKQGPVPKNSFKSFSFPLQ